MKTRIPWAIWMDKWCQNELKWTQMKTGIHEQYGWTNDAKMNSNEDCQMNPISNMDGQMMPKWTQMKTWIPWAIWMDKWCQNELKWRVESYEQYGWTNDAIMNTSEDFNPLSNIDGQMMPKWTRSEDLNPMSNIDGQMMLKWTQIKTWIPWAILYGQMMPKWTKMNSNEDLNLMSNMGGQMMPK